MPGMRIVVASSAVMAALIAGPAAAGAAPAVVLTDPTPTEDISGLEDLTVHVDVTPVRVDYYVDGSRVAWDTTWCTWGEVWDTTGWPDGRHVIVATATDAAGEVGTSAPVTVVKGIVADSPAPGVRLTDPAQGEVLSGIEDFTVALTGEVVRVDYYVDGERAAWDSTCCTWGEKWDTSAWKDGEHTVLATATGPGGGVGTSAPVTVVVANGGDPEPEPTPVPDPSGDPVIAGAGDIASYNRESAATADLLDAIPGLASVFTTGDHAYPDGTDADYQQYYAPTWGRLKAETRPVPGNHDYHLTDAAGYFNYFGEAAGARGKGWYSYDVGGWHVIALNTSAGCTPVPCGPGSEQYAWLLEDLAANPKACTLAYWHHPLFTAGRHAPGVRAVRPLVQALYAAGAELVINGHDHNYQRYAPMDPDGQRDDLIGIREFVVGTGGSNEYAVAGPGGNLEASATDVSGVLALTLHPDGYDWRFVPVAGGTYTDAGSGSCH
jgi:hypothetical protein